MKLSIITATYNSDKTLDKCLESVAHQTALDSIEHIIVDGRSCDATLAIAAQYPHINKIVSEPDRGIYHAFNKGVKLATGDIIYFLNSDDWFFDNNVIKDVLSEFTDEAEFLAAKIILYNDETGLGTVHPKGLNSKEDYKHPGHQGFFCRKKSFESIGMFNECFSVYADTYMMRMLTNKREGVFSERIIAYFKSGGVSTSCQNAEKNKAENYILTALLDFKISENEVNNKITYGLDTHNKMRNLFLRYLSGDINFSFLHRKKVIVFGAHELSKIMHRMLLNQNIKTYGLLVTEKKDCMFDENYKLYDIKEIKGLAVDVIINCIEGMHEGKLSGNIMNEIPHLKVISWRDI